MNKKIKFLGIPIGKECIKNDIYRKRILFHEIKFNLNERHVTYRFFGIKYLTVTFSLKEILYNCFNIIKFTKNSKNKVNLILYLLIYYVKDKLKTDKFDILYMYIHSGEIFLSMYHIKEYIEKNQIKNPVFVTTKAYNRDSIKMFFPEIPVILVPLFCNLSCQNSSVLKYKDYTIRMYLPPSHFWEFEQKLKNGEKLYFYDEIKKTMNVSSELKTLPVISEEDKEDAEAKMKLIGLKKPFIYISSEALSSKTYSMKFWEKLHVEIFKLNQKLNGEYDIFYNTIPLNSQNTYYKYCYLSFPQAKYVASQADIIIGIRSGLMDIIANTTSKIFCIYFPFYRKGKYYTQLTAENVIQGYTIKKIPNINPDNVSEYNAEITEEDEIIKDIINKILNLRKTNETV